MKLQVTPRHDRLQRDALLLLAGQCFYRGTGILLLGFLARVLPAKDLGIYFFAVSFAGALTTLASFNLNPLVMRQVASAPEETPDLFAPLLGYRLMSGPLYLLVVAGAAFLFARAIFPILVVAAVCALLESVYFAFGGLFLARRKAVYNVVIGVAVEALFLLVTLLAMRRFPSLWTLLAANVLRGLLLVGAAVWVAQRWICPLRARWDGRLLRQAVPFLLIPLIAVLRERVDTLALGFLGDYGAVGHYQLALRIVVAAYFVPLTVGQVLFPQLSAEGLTRETRRALGRSIAVLGGLGMLGAAAAFAGAGPLTAMLYGPRGADVEPLLRALAPLFPLAFLDLFLVAALQALYQERQVVRGVATGAATSLLANCVLIPRCGAHGAAHAQVVAELVQLGVMGWYAHRLWQQSAGRADHRHETGVRAVPAVDAA